MNNEIDSIISTQTVLKMGNNINPISLNVNLATDYLALGITVTATVIIALISAYVTVRLVLKSNSLLIKNQLKQQSNDVRSKNRQEWINKVRTDISIFLSKSLLIHNIYFRYINLQIALKQNEGILEDFKIVSKNLNVLQDELLNMVIKLDLTLSATDTLDRQIVKLADEIFESFEELIGKIENLVNSDANKIYSNSDVNKFAEIQKIKVNVEKINEATKVLLKREWERVKNFE